MFTLCCDMIRVSQLIVLPKASVSLLASVHFSVLL
jgi:hypothetical protein